MQAEGFLTSTSSHQNKSMTRDVQKFIVRFHIIGHHFDCHKTRTKCHHHQIKFFNIKITHLNINFPISLKQNK